MTQNVESEETFKKRLANLKQWAFDLAMREVRLISVALVAVGLLAGGCESLRPPAQDRAVWEVEQEQKQSDTSAQENGMADLLYWIAYDTASVLVH